MKSALAIQCLPMGGGNKEDTYRMVDKAIDVIDASGLPYTVSPMETVVEGPVEKLFRIAEEAHKAVIAAGAVSVATYMKIFSSPDLGSSEDKTKKYRERGH